MIFVNTHAVNIFHYSNKLNYVDPFRFNCESLALLFANYRLVPFHPGEAIYLPRF